MIDIGLLEAARRAFSCGNYNEARYLYQQIAYGYNQFTELEKEAFTKEVSIFAGSDPLYQQILQHIISHIKNTGEPVLQSTLTSVIKQDLGEPGAELLRYVLYYADYRDEVKRIKQGRSYVLSLPLTKIQSALEIQPLEELSPKLTKIYFESSIQYQPDCGFLNEIKSVNDYVTLQKLATRFKKINWNESLTCLYKANQLVEESKEAQSLQNITRLALFLQQAGRFEEAKFELQRLFENVDNYVINYNKMFSKTDELRMQWMESSYLAHLFDKARLIYRREKLIDESKQFLELSEQYKKTEIELHQKLQAKFEQDRLDDWRREQLELEKLQLEAEETRKRRELLLLREEKLRKEVQAQKQQKTEQKQEQVDDMGMLVFIGFILIMLVLIIIIRY